MKVKFMGTSASEGFPAVFCNCDYCSEARRLKGKNLRRRSSIVIDDLILVDFGPDTYAAGLYGDVDLSRIQHIFYTHSHTDHCYGDEIFNLEIPMRTTNMASPMFLYGNREVHKKIARLFDDSPFRQTSSEFIEIYPGNSIKLDDYEVTALEANHAGAEKALLYIVKHREKVLFYCLDTGHISIDTWKIIKQYKYDALILDCTSIGMKSPFEGHMGALECKELWDLMKKDGLLKEGAKAYLTHFAHEFNALHENTEKVAEKYGFIAAYDNLVINV